MSRQLSSWIRLPDSKYGIDYSLEDLKATKKHGSRWGSSSSRPPLRLIRNTLGTGAFPAAAPVQKKKTMQNPFELRLQALTTVVRRSNHPEGTGLLYIREIFEPGDPEFDFLEATINVSQLTQEQVDRLQIMIVPQRREEILLGYLDYQEASDKLLALVQSPSSDHAVLRNFESFQRRYASTIDTTERLDILFGFTFAIQKHSGWMYYQAATATATNKTPRARATMVASLARQWRQLLHTYYPEQLGLDREFSYPAVLTFLQRFKDQVETTIDTFCDSPIQFHFFEVDDSHGRRMARGSVE
jgi:hypothetical protein